MIYVSSTADLFIAGLGNSVALPVWLAVLAVGGVLAGIVLRVRAFLFLGISFLLLDVFTMIWFAAVDRYQTWVWWASGIVLGAAVLALFGLFEKRQALIAPMAGTIVKVYVQEGEEVQAQQTLIILTAMKMEHAVTAPYNGKIKRIYSREGEAVKGNAVLLEME